MVWFLKTILLSLRFAALSVRSWGSPPVCPGALAAPECLGPNMRPWVTPPYCPGLQSLLQVTQKRAPNAAIRTMSQACFRTQTSPQPGNQAMPWIPIPLPHGPGGGCCVPGYLWVSGILTVTRNCTLPSPPNILETPASDKMGILEPQCRGATQLGGPGARPCLPAQ